MAAGWRQNRDDREREDCPEQTRRHEMLSVSLFSACELALATGSAQESVLNLNWWGA
jgi:hypothetical protein